jgi:hypothetical protein
MSQKHMCNPYSTIKNVQLCIIYKMPKYEALHIDQRNYLTVWLNEHLFILVKKKILL